MPKLDQGSIRKHNLYQLWKIIYDNPGITRQELAKQSSLSLMSVTNLVTCLEKQQALSIYRDEESVKAHTGAGRKADNIALSDDNHMWVMLDLTDIHFRYSIFTLNMRSIPAYSSFQYNPACSYEQNLLTLLSELKEHLGSLLLVRELIGIAVSVPGPYDISADTVNNIRVPQISNLRLKRFLSHHLGNFSYYIDEDVKFAVRAYMTPHSACDLLYYLYIGEGVGGAACLGDTVLRGLNAVAGDASQLLTQQDGSYDTFESAVSLRSFVHTLNIAASRSILGPPQDALLNSIQAYAVLHPDAYRKALSHMAEHIARMLYNVLWILDPCRVVIDCRYAAFDEEGFMNDIHAALRSLTANSLPRLPECIFASASVSAINIGAMQVIIKAWISRILEEG